MVQVVKIPASVREVEVPAETKTLTRQVLKTPAYYKEEVLPADYIQVTRQVFPAGYVPADTNGSAQVGVLPAEYKTITKQVLKVPGSLREELIPAEYVPVIQQVLKAPASTSEELIPGKEEQVTIKVIKTPEKRTTELRPAEYASITKHTLVKQGGFTEWQEVLCPEKITSATIGQLQRALAKAGYDPGPVDQSLGAKTREALLKFQKDKGLPMGNVDVGTLRALGLPY
jgi:hypothetical protein